MNWRHPVVAAAILGSVFLPKAVRGQDGVADESELWTDAAVRLETPVGIDATYTQHLRWKENMSRLHLVAPEFALKYGATDWLVLESGYRYLYERDNDGLYQHRNRIFANARLRPVVGPFGFEFRAQWQKEYRDELDDGTPRRQVLRLRAKVKYRDESPLRPYASVESFRRLDDADPDISGGTLTALRWTLGAEWRSGAWEYDLHYHLITPQHDLERATRHILAVGFRFDLDPWK